MRKSDTIAELTQSLIKVQGVLKPVSKTGDNPFFKSKYAPLDVVVQYASPLIAQHGLAITQLVSHNSGQPTLETVLLHKSGEYISNDMLLQCKDENPQAQGSAITYARRYAYMAILGITATDEDDDANTASQAATARDIDTLKSLAYKNGVETAEQYEKLLLASISTTHVQTKDQVEAVKQYIKNNKEVS